MTYFDGNISLFFLRWWIIKTKWFTGKWLKHNFHVLLSFSNKKIMFMSFRGNVLVHGKCKEFIWNKRLYVIVEFYGFQFKLYRSEIFIGILNLWFMRNTLWFSWFLWFPRVLVSLVFVRFKNLNCRLRCIVMDQCLNLRIYVL